ncbi:MAG: 4Fe-4S dicluster domain-containing protein [Ruminococcaceae bacterium]|nr:4Fe-4S dicluster domain-containing protein [Oscillospiraceae bacterium]
MNKLHMDSAPYLRHADSTKSIMADVIFMLLALTAWSVFTNGPRALTVCLLCLVFCFIFELVCGLFFKAGLTVKDLSFAVTALILAGCMPNSVPLWMCPVASFLAIVIFKALFGGLGKNLLNPAAAALLAVNLIFPISMTLVSDKPDPLTPSFDLLPGSELPMSIFSQGSIPPQKLEDLLLGSQQGILFFSPAILTALCLLYLCIRHTADARLSISFLVFNALPCFFSVPVANSLEYTLGYLLSSGVMFAAAFMVTDPVTTPATKKGRIVFGSLAGLMCFACVRLTGGIAGMYLAICICNLLSPVIEALTLPVPFGTGIKRAKGKKTAKRHKDYVTDFLMLVNRQKRSPAANEKKMKAVLLCLGSDPHCQARHSYDGAKNCASVALVGGGSKSCFNACEGLGDCVSACKKGAIRIVSGIAAIDAKSCDGCGDCVDACPKRLISLIGEESVYVVGCMSPDDPVSTRKNCSAGCIGCRRCEKVCPTEAIKVDSNIARIDQSLCCHCGSCVNECPRNCIWELK